MKTNELEAIIALSEQVFRNGEGKLHCTRDKNKQNRYKVVLSVTDAKGTEIYSTGFWIELDLLKLQDAFRARDKSNNPVSIITDEKAMGAFLEIRAFEVIRHLKAFNGVADDYAAIAELAHSVRGAISAVKFGV